MKQRVVFTGADRIHSVLFFQMFYPTLRQFGGYTGDVKVVLLGRFPARDRKALERRGMAIDTRSNAVDLNMTWKYTWADRLQREYREVYYFDCDIWFQSNLGPLFEQTRAGKISVGEEAYRFRIGRLRKSDGFNERAVNRLIGEFPHDVRREVWNGLKGRRVINSGFFCAKSAGRAVAALSHYRRGFPRIGFGYNQAVLNLWAQSFPETIHRIPLGYVLPLANTPGRLREDPPGCLRIGSKPVVAVHANNHRAMEKKLGDARFARFVKAHPEFRPGLDQAASNTKRAKPSS